MLWGAAITILFICAFQWLNFCRKREKRNEKLILFGFAAFIFCTSLAHVFWLMSEFFIPGTYKNNTFYGDFNSASPTFYFLYKLGDITCSIGFIVCVLTFEIILKRTKYILTVLISSIVAIQIFSSYEMYTLIQQYIMMPLFFLLTIVIILLYAKWSRYELKAISSLLLFGFLIMAIGTVLYTPVVKAANAIPLIMASIIVMIGALIIISPTFIDPKHFSRARIYWGLSGISVIILSWFLLFFLIAVGISTAAGIEVGGVILIFIINIVVAMFMLYYSMKIIKHPVITEVKDTQPNILEIFTRPQKVTEEEVSVSKEKKICLVCKGKLAGFNLAFICRECDALYCENCARILSDLENACWVCDFPFDETKPSKPYKKEAEEVDIEVSEKPQKKPKTFK
jgi:hypothetical protein